VSDLDPALRVRLERLVPLGDAVLADWEDAIVRSWSSRPRRGRRTRRSLALVAAAVLAASVLVVATPVGGALSRGLSDFSDWLGGTPGEPAGEQVQRDFERSAMRSWVRFPEPPKLRRLLRLRGERYAYSLYGFRAGNAVCLQVVGKPLESGSRALACLSRSELERSRDLAIVVRANVSLGRSRRLPRRPGDAPTVPRVLATVGFAAEGTRRIDVVSDEGRSAAALANGAFLHVLEHPDRGTWYRSAVASSDERTQTLPIVVSVHGEPPLPRTLRARGPTEVERHVGRGAIGWFERREPRGEPAPQLVLDDLRDHVWGNVRFARVIQPDPHDYLRMLFAEWDTGIVCAHFVTREGVIGGGCSPRLMSRARTLSVTAGYSGAGQQFWVLSGVAADDVARIEAFLATGERRPVPLADNAVIGRIPAAKLPARVVAYDDEGRIVDIETIRAPR
jgi:hypothetical protein